MAPELVPDDLQLQRRGLILGALRLQAPLPTAGAMLESAVSAFYAGEPAGELLRDLDYLQVAGLIHRAQRRLGPQLVRVYSLTASGYRVLDGTGHDPGVAPPAPTSGV